MKPQCLKEREKAAKTIFEVVEERSTIYRKRNRNRAIAGTAIAATAGLFGATAGAWAADKIDGDCRRCWPMDCGQIPRDNWQW